MKDQEIIREYCILEVKSNNVSKISVQSEISLFHKEFSIVYK